MCPHHLLWRNLRYKIKRIVIPYRPSLASVTLSPVKSVVTLHITKKPDQEY